MKSLVFTAKSQYARFRCSHTTTSALTYSVIHPPAVKGMIGAVMGIGYDKLFEYVSDIKIGIQVLKPVIKDMQSFNLIAMTGNNGASNFQSRIQFLRNVKYRLFISTYDRKLSEIEYSIYNHDYVFTPYMGCSEHIAKLVYERIAENKASKETYSDTIIPKDYTVFENKNNYIINFDRIPVKNTKEREYSEYCNIVFSASNKLKTKQCKLIKVGKYNVFFF